MKAKVVFTLLSLIILSTALVIVMVYCFNNVPAFKELFAAPGAETFGNVAPESEETIAKRGEFTAKVSMWIFTFITILQMVAVWIGYAVVSGIRHSNADAGFKLKNLENAEIFFDIPLYFGLFGTVSAFLVMTFSPQSSRLIAYSSTLIGIIFNLVLRLSMQYPLRRRLMREQYEQNRGNVK